MIPPVRDNRDYDLEEQAMEASEPRERSAPTKRRAGERVGESEGRSPSDLFWRRAKEWRPR